MRFYPTSLLAMLFIAGLVSPVVPRAPVATPASPEVVPPGTWELQAIVYADGREAVPANPASYTIAFFPGERSVTYSDGHPDPGGEPDGRIGLQLDCNGGSADYLVDGSQLTITSVLSTSAGCLPPGLGMEFADRLLAVTSYALQEGELVFFLDDGGRLRFVPPGAASPAAGVSSVPRQAVPPSECWVEPRPLADLAAVLGRDREFLAATPAAVTITVPLGRAAPQRTAAALEDTVFAYLACRNAGDVPRMAALLTDAAARRLLGEDAAARAVQSAAQLATPTALSPLTRTRLAFVTDTSILPDGRAAALAVISDPLTPPRGRQTLLFILVRQGNRWLIDDLIGFSIPLPPTAATPMVGTPTP
jgi:hypothetical protein